MLVARVRVAEHGVYRCIHRAHAELVIACDIADHATRAQATKTVMR